MKEERARPVSCARGTGGTVGRGRDDALQVTEHDDLERLNTIHRMHTRQLGSSDAHAARRGRIHARKRLP